MRRLLAYRDARLLLAGETLSAFGDWAMWFVMAIWMKSLTGSSAQAGLVFFVLALGNLAGPLGGLLVDRLPRRRLMIATDCVLGVSVLSLLFLHSRGDAWLIYLVALLYGVGGTVFFPARAALLRLMLPEELLADANGALSSVRQGLRIVAPLAGAGLYAAFGQGRPVAILDAATFAGSALLLARIRVVEEKPEPSEQHFLGEVTAGIDHVWRTVPLRQMVFGTTLALLVVGFTETLIFTVIAHLGRQPSFFGVLGTLQGVGSIVGGVTAASLVRRVGELRTVRHRPEPVRRVRHAARRPLPRRRAPRLHRRRRRDRLGHRRLQHRAPDADAARDPGSRLRCVGDLAHRRPDDLDRDGRRPLDDRRLPDPPRRDVGGRHRKLRLPRDPARAAYSGRSRSANNRLTTFGSAFPCVSRITWPTRKPSTPSLPPRYVSTCSGCAAMTPSTIGPSAPSSPSAVLDG